MNNPAYPIILFDGHCNLCNSSVQFIIQRDPNKQFRFASLQSDFGKSILANFNLSTSQINTVILLDSGKIYTRSTAALMIAKRLSGGWSYLYAFSIIPAFIRDLVYNLIANNRYKWFGKKESCWIPTPALKDLFIENN
ncbi:MAG: thiol-disulfide oxidoreductase DCC family protein [Sediminibacterium sp.]|nr:MAG: hypothetical protein FD183_1739 [Chitinophagaceae bacterium]MDP1844707.1 thiol-disulfide oxidoreductase DCC family protein [Sediminibacterium sp.]